MTDTVTPTPPERATKRADAAPTSVTRFFTFGYGHVCPFSGQSLADKYATVTAASISQCRDVMLATFGRQWAFEYSSVEAASVPGHPLTEHARLELVA